MTTSRPVIVRAFPERVNSVQAQAFFSQMQELLQSVQPCVVFDFAAVCELDTIGVQVLLRCLEEAMKRNGDVKLAAVSPGPAVVLELTSVDGLFEIYETTEDAVQSFHHPSLLPFGQKPVAMYATQQPSGEAASCAAD